MNNTSPDLNSTLLKLISSLSTVYLVLGINPNLECNIFNLHDIGE